MTDKAALRSAIEAELADTQYYLVDITVSPDNTIDVEIDADEGVELDFCVRLSDYIHSKFDPEQEDYELTVGSAGLTSPFKVKRQYDKNIGNDVEVLTQEGRKVKGMLVSADPESFTVETTVMERREGDKRKKAYPESLTFKYSEVKQTKIIF